MQTLLNMFEEEDREIINPKEKQMKDLKDIYDRRTKKKDYKEFRFHMKTIFSFIKSTSPESVKIQAGKREKKIDKLEFNPTVSPPDIIMSDKEVKPYSIWYKPMIFVPSEKSAKRLVPEFLIMKGERKSMYNIDNEFKKSLYTYEFLSGSSLKKASKELIDKMHKPHLIIHAQREYLYRDLYAVKDSNHYLNPEKLAVISEKELPPDVKMNVPLNVTIQEKVDLSTRKLQDRARALLN